MNEWRSMRVFRPSWVRVQRCSWLSCGWHVIGEYVDRASGIKESRPALNRLMTDARRRKFDMIAVWKIDRFGRSLKHLVNALAELEAVGVAFVSLRDNLDLSTPAGRLMFQIIAAMAEFERALIPFGIAPGHFQFSVTRFQLLYPDHFPLLCLAMNYGSKLLKVR